MKHEIALNTEIENILYLQTKVNHGHVNYILHKNVIILKGIVANKHNKRSIKQAILNLKGIKIVIDKMLVKNESKNSLYALLQ